MYKPILNSIAIVSLCGLVLTGCQKQAIKPERSEVDLMLDQQINETHHMVQKVSRNGFGIDKDSGRTNSNTVDRNLIPEILKTKMNIKWYGKAETVLQSLADSLGKDVVFIVKGARPSRPHDVFLNEDEVELFAILENVGHQLPDDIILEVIIDPLVQSKVRMELLYNNGL